MRIKIKYKGKCTTLAYINLSTNSVVGWYVPKLFNYHLSDKTLEKLNYHVTYPVDGNLHYTFDYFDPNKKLFFQKRVYFDHVRIKKFDVNQRYIDYSDSKRDANDIMQHFMNTDKYERLDSDKFNLYEFPQTAIGLNEKVLASIQDTYKEDDAEDIIFNIDGMENAILNYGFSLYKTSRKELYQSGAVKRFLAFGDIYIEGYIRKLRD